MSLSHSLSYSRPVAGLCVGLHLLKEAFLVRVERGTENLGLDGLKVQRENLLLLLCYYYY